MGQRQSGRVAVVTGAATGLGRAYAQRLAQEGAQVCVADLADAGETVAMIEGDGGKAWAGACDVTSQASIGAFVAEVRERFGRCDVLVNNAGIYPLKPFMDVTVDDLRAIMAVNVEGVLLMSQAVVPLMRDNGYGRIVNISSTTAMLVVPDFSAYVASKMAVIGLTRSMATELAEFGINVNCACPSLVRTATTESGPQAQMFDAVAGMQAIKRVQEPQDMTGTVAFLCSEDAGFMTGQTLVADGGLIRL